MHAQQRRPTMFDVAKAASVSQSTVSFVLNDRRDIVVADATRERVLAAAKDLGYRLNRRAQELRLSRSSTLGVVSHGVASHPHAGQMLAGLQRAARDGGFVCMIVDIDDDTDPGDDLVSGLIDRDVAGLVHIAAGTHAVNTSAVADAVRVLFAGCWPADGDTGEGSVLPDDFGGGAAAARHLFDLGHREVAFLGGGIDDPATADRESGLDRVAGDMHLDRTRIIRRYGDYGVTSGFELTRALFAERRVTGLICGNDQMALGAMLALQELGRRVPDDVSIVGYDDQEGLASSVRPALTTVRLPHYEIGLRAAQMLIGAAPAHPVIETLPCSLIIRDTTTSPPFLTNTY